MVDDYSILVIGCMKHEEIAERYFELAKIYWPDSLDNTIFCTDVVTDYQRSFSKKIVFDTTNSFATRILSGIKKTKNDFIILMLDDYYLIKKINQADLDSLITYMKNDNINYCKLVGMPKCFSKNCKFSGTYHIKQNTHYGISLQPSIWKKDALVNALKVCKIGRASCRERV